VTLLAAQLRLFAVDFDAQNQRAGFAGPLDYDKI